VRNATFFVVAIIPPSFQYPPISPRLDRNGRSRHSPAPARSASARSPTAVYSIAEALAVIGVENASTLPLSNAVDFTGERQSFKSIGKMLLEVTVANDDSCEPISSASLATLFNVDDAPNTSRTDPVESPSSLWTPGGAVADRIWSRVEVAPFSHAGLGIDVDGVSDTTLTSPALQVGRRPFTIAFDHRFSFESEGGVASWIPVMGGRCSWAPGIRSPGRRRSWADARPSRSANA
jgi:hypothetical protein